MPKRLLTLFKLLNESDDKITCKALSNHLKVSERTIRTDITSINETLEKNGAIIKIKKGEGYYIDIVLRPKSWTLYRNEIFIPVFLALCNFRFIFKSIFNRATPI